MEQRLEELEERKEQLEISILEEEMGNPILSREQVEFWLSMFREIDITDCAQWQRLVDVFINAIYLYDDEVVFAYIYSEDTKTIMLDEIKEKLCSDLGAHGAQSAPGRDYSPGGVVRSVSPLARQYLAPSLLQNILINGIMMAYRF